MACGYFHSGSAGENRLKERGYNQVDRVARVAYEVGLQYGPRALVEGARNTFTSGLTISQRQENVQNAYQADPMVVQCIRLLMDDVATTGSKILACTDALLLQARDVYVITIARALSHHNLTRV